MPRKITIVVGHPDPSPSRYGRALADAYARGAFEGSHAVRRIDLAELDFPMLHSQQHWESGEVPESLRQAQQDLMWADHVAIFYPLWLGDAPAKLKAFLEQVLRPGESVSLRSKPLFGKRLSGNKTARVVVTMDRPAWLYRWGFGAHSLNNLKRNVLWFIGVNPVLVRYDIIGMVAAKDPTKRRKWLLRMQALGREAS